MKEAEALNALCLAAPRSGSGKTTISLAMMAALRRRGCVVQAFKCGPDYLDPAWHRAVTGRPSYNLDTWMMGREGVRRAWRRHAANADWCICEGVMGLFDGCSPGDGRGSTADCALALGLPVVLVVPARGMASSLAALVKGFASFDPRLNLAGVIANGVGGARHADLLRLALEREGLAPLVGAFPHREAWALPERHLGLVPPGEPSAQPAWAEAWADAAEASVDWELLASVSTRPRPCAVCAAPSSAPSRRLAVARDEAFFFYYDSLAEGLRREGWEWVEFSPLVDKALPEGIDAVYLGGGYPEVFAEALARNAEMRAALADFARRGGEIYAECGGYMYLCDELVCADGRSFPMCGVLHATARMGTRRRELGYREIRWLAGAPFGLPIQASRGHEFHWSEVELHADYSPLYAWSGGGRSGEAGVAWRKVRAGYMHVCWESALVSCAERDEGFQPGASFRPGGRALLLNGASSAGKTSLAHALRESEPGAPWMVMSVDAFLSMCGSPTGRAVETVEEAGLPLMAAFHAAIAAAARAGAWVIVDHVAGECASWIADWEARLQGLPCAKIRVECREEVLRLREETRRDRPADWEHARRQAARIHELLVYDACVETSEDSPEECAELLRDKLGAMGFCPKERVGGERPPAHRAD